LTDVVAILVGEGAKVGAFVTDAAEETQGINSRAQLAEAELVIRRRKLTELMDAGVTIMDVNSTYVDQQVSIGPDTILYPGTWIEGASSIGSGCCIGPNTRLQNTTVGDAAELHFTYAHDCRIGNGVTVGPYVHLRPGTNLADNVKIGNFVEVKNANIGEGSKLPHLIYCGDADLGSKVNLGCGTVTVNYDGKLKHRTTVEDNAFVGCNSNLVAPVTVGAGAYVAAGSTITKDVPAQALGVARARQSNIEGWVAKRRNQE